MKTETTRETAEKIAAEHIGSASYYAEQRRFCADAIESALDAERERAAKIAEADAELCGFASEGHATAKRIAAAIRGSKE